MWDLFFCNGNDTEGQRKLYVGSARGLCLYNQQLADEEKQLTNGKGSGHN